jgi:hypothetical protein
MKNTKMIAIICSCILFGFILGACGSEVIAEQNYPLKIWSENRNGQMETWCLVDENTGVNYIVVAPKFTGTNGSSYDGVCITPRLNPDGTLYTSK